MASRGRQAQDLTGQQFGSLTVIERADNRGQKVYWRCQCAETDRTVEVQAGNLKSGSVRSGRTCAEAASLTHSTHRHKTSAGPSPTYRSWEAMKQRCTNPSNNRWAYYGERGVEICQRWLWSFENFLEDLGERPEGTTLDRLDVNGNYEPGNVRWATPKQQRANRRDAIISRNELEYA